MALQAAASNATIPPSSNGGRPVPNPVRLRGCEDIPWNRHPACRNKRNADRLEAYPTINSQLLSTGWPAIQTQKMDASTSAACQCHPTTQRPASCTQSLGCYREATYSFPSHLAVLFA